MDSTLVSTFQDFYCSRVIRPSRVQVNGFGGGISAGMLRVFNSLSRGIPFFVTLFFITLMRGHRGFSFGYSAFINSHFLGSGQGTSRGQSGVDILQPTFNFTSAQLVPGDNGMDLCFLLVLSGIIERFRL